MITDEFKVSNDLILTANGINLKQRSYPFSDISEIYLLVSNVKVNFVSMGNDYTFYLALLDGNSIEINSGKLFSKNVSLENVSKCYSYLASKTLVSRRNLYLNQLENEGYFDYQPNEVRIYKNGDVNRKGKTVNLKKAASEGKIYFGVERGVPGTAYYSADPNKIIIFEKSRFLSLTKGKLSFKCLVNRDVIIPILKTMAYTKSSFKLYRSK